MEENNEEFGIALVTIIFLAFILPSIVLFFGWRYMGPIYR